jgi:beta-glucosidase
VVECPAHVELAREAAEKSIVLLRNEGGVLPLSRGPNVSIAIVGDLADTENLGDRGSSMVTPSRVTTPLAGLRAAAGAAAIEYFPSEADLSRLADFDVAVVVAGLTWRDEGEFIPVAQEQAEAAGFARGGDRADLALPAPQRRLVERAAAAARRTVVVLQGGAAILVDDWIDSVEGLLMAWYGGREGGHALARVLFGDVSPSGRLPMAWPRSMDQLMEWDVGALRVPHGLLHGQRWLDHHGLEPRFPFGFGLGYTSFEITDLDIARASEGFTIHVDVRNTGSRRGAAVPQLYVGARGSRVLRAQKELAGFGRVELESGAAVTLAMRVADADLRFYDPERRSWELEACDYCFSLGSSSADLPLSATWRYDEAGWRPVDRTVDERGAASRRG